MSREFTNAAIESQKIRKPGPHRNRLIAAAIDCEKQTLSALAELCEEIVEIDTAGLVGDGEADRSALARHLVGRLNSAALKGCELQLQSAASSDVKWNMTSPKMEQRYPQGINRSHARFIIRSVFREEDTGYDMVITAGLERISLFNIQILRNSA